MVTFLATQDIIKNKLLLTLTSVHETTVAVEKN